MMIRTRPFGSFFLSIVLCACLVSAAFLLVRCGTSSDEEAADDSDDTTDDTTDDADDADDDTAAGCSDDDSDVLAVGTYTFTESDDDVQVRIFREDCTYCSETLEEDETDAQEDGAWTSGFDDDPAEAGQEIRITAGGIVYELSGDGLTLEAAAFDLTFFKDTTPNITCGGETAD